VETFEKYGFEPAETPMIEYEEFVRGQNQNDEAVSDIFKLKDKGKRKLALRYEFTFQLKRIAKNKKIPYKRYQIGEVFRDEPVQSNRVRQFTQCDVDIVGSTIKDEAEILALANEIFEKLGIKIIIYFNNRKLLNEILDELKIRNKEKVLREIDKLDKLSEKQVKKNLKKDKTEKILQIIKKPENYFKKYKSYSDIEELKNLCKIYNVKLIFLPSLARGLSYYNRSVFEVRVKDTKESICAGGSYRLYEGNQKKEPKIKGISAIQSTGISFGLERLSLVAKLKTEKEKFLIISLNQDKKAINLVQKMRKQGKNTVLFYGKPSKALEYANSYKINKVIFVGKEEIKKKKFKIKDMKTGKETYEKL
jgi:histidyl-tRNA synthetase